MVVPKDKSKNDFMIAAYVGFLHWAVAEPDVLIQFKAATGLNFPGKPRSGLEALIDAACKVDADKETDAVMPQFILWATQNLWGEDMAPSFYFKLKDKFAC